MIPLERILSVKVSADPLIVFYNKYNSLSLSKYKRSDMEISIVVINHELNYFSFNLVPDLDLTREFHTIVMGESRHLLWNNETGIASGRTEYFCSPPYLVGGIAERVS